MSEPQSWLMFDVGVMGAKFLDLRSVGRSSEPELLDVVELVINPETEELFLTQRKTYALWCSNRQAELRSFTKHYEDGRSSRPGDPPPEKLVRHPVEDDDFPGTPGKHGVGPSKGSTSRLAQIVCDGNRMHGTFVEDPAKWVRANLPPVRRSSR